MSFVFVDSEGEAFHQLGSHAEGVHARIWYSKWSVEQLPNRMPWPDCCWSHSVSSMLGTSLTLYLDLCNTPCGRLSKVSRCCAQWSSNYTWSIEGLGLIQQWICVYIYFLSLYKISCNDNQACFVHMEVWAHSPGFVHMFPLVVSCPKFLVVDFGTFWMLRILEVEYIYVEE